MDVEYPSTLNLSLFHSFIFLLLLLFPLPFPHHVFFILFHFRLSLCSLMHFSPLSHEAPASRPSHPGVLQEGDFLQRRWGYMCRLRGRPERRLPRGLRGTSHVYWVGLHASYPIIPLSILTCPRPSLDILCPFSSFPTQARGRLGAGWLGVLWAWVCEAKQRWCLCKTYLPFWLDICHSRWVSHLLFPSSLMSLRFLFLY